MRNILAHTFDDGTRLGDEGEFWDLSKNCRIGLIREYFHSDESVHETTKRIWEMVYERIHPCFMIDDYHCMTARYDDTDEDWLSDDEREQIEKEHGIERTSKQKKRKLSACVQ